VFRGHHGAVVDFISLPRWPTFNVGDACIVIGVILFVILQLRRWSEEEHPEGRGSPPSS
jgi:lipoprotein signal peptidase